jgi:hypothetical protein
MADEKDNKNTNKAKKNANSGNKATIAFFVILIIGLIIVTVIILTRTTSKIYSTQYGICTVLIEIYTDNTMDLAVDIEDKRTLKHGTYEALEDGTYKGTFEGEEGDSANVSISIVDQTLTLTFEDDGTTMTFTEVTTE